MPYRASVFEVLIASPSDVIVERDAVEATIHDWNGEHSRAMGVVLLPRRWEKHSSPEMGNRPQEILNKQLGTADILVGIFWSKLGTPTGKAESGTVEEIGEFIDQRKSVLLYFSSAPVPNSVDTEQLAKLRQFKRGIQDKALYREFGTVQQLTDMVRQHLTTEVRKKAPNAGSSPESRGASSPTVDSATGPNRFVSQFRSFVRQLEANWEAERDSDPGTIDGGVRILRDADRDIQSFMRASNDPGDQDALGNVLKKVRKLERHEVVMDGGTSFGIFWINGNEVVADLRGILNDMEGSVGGASRRAAQGDQQDSQKLLGRLQAQTDNVLRKFDAEWKAERDSEPPNIDGGKAILARVRSDLVGIRSQYGVNSFPDVAQAYDDALKELRVLERHRLFGDGGNSYRAFWTGGNGILTRLQETVKLIERMRPEEEPVM